jgi:hypothetical protein
VGNSLIETAGEANDIQAEVAPETLVDVGQTNALAQVLIILVMVMVSMENETSSYRTTCPNSVLNS